MANFEAEGGTTRDDLVQRVALMETMIAEGRRSTIRFGWIFVLWGLIDLAPVGWQLVVPHSDWVEIWSWPIAIACGVAIQFLGMAILRRRSSVACSSSMRGRSISAVWAMMGLTAMLYFAGAMISHKAWQISFAAAMLMFVGMAHGTSALILRWKAQGVVACVWWIGGIALFFLSYRYWLQIFASEMCFGMIGFGLYAMWLERRNRAAEGQTNA
jgi:hypothetical protein